MKKTNCIFFFFFFGVTRRCQLCTLVVSLTFPCSHCRLCCQFSLKLAILQIVGHTRFSLGTGHRVTRVLGLFVYSFICQFVTFWGWGPVLRNLERFPYIFIFIQVFVHGSAQLIGMLFFPAGLVMSVACLFRHWKHGVMGSGVLGSGMHVNKHKTPTSSLSSCLTFVSVPSAWLLPS